MKEPIILTLTAREALALLNASLMARLDKLDTRAELASAEDKIAQAVKEATQPIHASDGQGYGQKGPLI